MNKEEYTYTPRERKYACLIAEGIPEYIAYTEAGFGENSSLKTIRGNASRLATKEKIKALVKEIQGANQIKTERSVKDRKKRLEDIAWENNTDKYGYKRGPNIAAIAELNKMEHVYAENTIEFSRTINIVVKDEKTKNLLERINEREVDV